MNRFFVLFGVAFCCLFFCATTPSFANIDSEGEKEPKGKKSTTTDTEIPGIYEGTTVNGDNVDFKCTGQAGLCRTTKSGSDAEGPYTEVTPYLRGDENQPLPPITIRNSANPGSPVPPPVPVQQGNSVIWTYSGVSID